MAETRAPPNYQYTPPAAQSTRQLLDSTSPSTSTDPNDVPFRPQNLARKSTNYAEADARARAAAAAETHASSAPGDGGAQGDEKQEAEAEAEGNTDSATAAGSRTPSASWRPKSGRKQSWNQQDFKREMHMSAVAEAGKGHGFTEAGTEH